MTGDTRANPRERGGTSTRIEGVPVPFARPRFGGNGHGYNTPAYARWKREAALQIRAAVGVPVPAGVPVEVEIGVYGERPRQRPAHVDRETWASGAACPRIGRSDLDNHVKAVLDACVDAGLLADDRQVVTIVARNWYAPARGRPCVELWVGRQ